MSKKVLVVSDFSCLGKTSIAASLPILSSSNLQCVGLPTCLLSAQTAFDGYYMTDLSCHWQEIFRHWRQIGIKFDGVLIGFCLESQTDDILALLEEFACDSTVIVDPVFGDYGKLYGNFSKKGMEKMKELCKRADYLLPNHTEGSFLAGGDTSEEIFERLTGQYKNVVLKGVKQDGKLGILTTEGFLGKKHIEGDFDGAGDVFASVFAARVLQGGTAWQGASEALDFVHRCIEENARKDEDNRFGLHFERFLKDLA